MPDKPELKFHPDNENNENNEKKCFPDIECKDCNEQRDCENLANIDIEKPAKLKHTPGPWELYEAVIEGMEKVVKSVAKAGIDSRKQWPMVCLIAPVDNYTDEQKANARLIAAAPEMLEALINNIKVALYLVSDKERIQQILNNSDSKLLEKATGEKIEDLIL